MERSRSDSWWQGGEHRVLLKCELDQIAGEVPDLLLAVRVIDCGHDLGAGERSRAARWASAPPNQSC
eukprot:5855069-Prymnesium_polylepis.1